MNGECWGEEDEEKTASPQVESGRLFIEKINLCPNKIKIIHNVQLWVGNQNKRTKIKKILL